MISKKLKNIKGSKTLELAAKAKELAEQGFPMISLTLGEPDWDTAIPAKNAGMNAIIKGQVKYTPAGGLYDVRQIVANKISKQLNTDYKADNVALTPGAKFAIFASLQALLDSGDEVIIPSPYWVSYPEMVKLSDGIPVIVDTKDSTQFKITPELLQHHITEKTKILLLCSPSNPTGIAYNLDELKAIGEVLKKYPKIVILSDDIYNEIYFHGSRAPHILDACPDLKARTVLINGGSKSYAMTGWRIGYVAGHRELIKVIIDYQSQALGCPSSLSQVALKEAILNADISKQVETLKNRAKVVADEVSKTSGLSLIDPDGAFYTWVNFDSILGKKYEGEVISRTEKLCEILMNKIYISTIPGEDFGMNGYLRMSIVVKEEFIREAFNRIREFISKLQ